MLLASLEALIVAVLVTEVVLLLLTLSLMSFSLLRWWMVRVTGGEWDTSVACG